MQASWIVNCTGPATANSAESNPAIGSLLVHGWIRPDELGLGLETTLAGNAINAAGETMPDLFVVGTLRKPIVWGAPPCRNFATRPPQLPTCVLAHINQACETTAKA